MVKKRLTTTLVDHILYITVREKRAI